MAKKNNAFSAEEISVFCEQISLILASSVPLQEGVDALADGYAGTPLEAAFVRLNDTMQMTGSLASAVEASEAFPSYVTGMIRVGEEAGQLDAVTGALAEHYQREAQIRRNTASAVRYPLTLMGVMALVIMVLVFQVLPIFEQAFRSLSGGAMGASASMLRIGQAAGVAVFAVMLAILGAAMAIWLLLKDGRRPALRGKLLSAVPALNRVHRLISGQRFASVLSMLLGGGFPMEQALELLPEVFDGQEEKQLMREAANRIFAGETLGEVIEQMKLFDPLHLRMIHVGIASGQADTAFARVAAIQAQKIDDAMARLISLIEPLLVIALSAMIGAILLSVMMPLAGVLSAMV